MAQPPRSLSVVLGCALATAACGGPIPRPSAGAVPLPPSASSTAPARACAEAEAPCLVGLAAAGDGTCAWTASGAFACWGGGFGRGRAESVFRAHLPSIAHVAVGDDVVCAVDASTIWCASPRYDVAANARGRLVRAIVYNQPQGLSGLAIVGADVCPAGTPAPICWSTLKFTEGALTEGRIAVLGGSAKVELWSGKGVECGRERSGGVLCSSGSAPKPTPVPGSAIVGMAPGRDATCALLADGSVHCWSESPSGRLGNGKTGASPDALVESLPPSAAIASGEGHTCALARGGGVWCWGENATGQLGDGTREARLRPVAVAGLPAKAVALALGDHHSCALLEDGAAWCWGNGGEGQLGRARSSARSPVLGIAMARDLAVWRADGSVSSWPSDARQPPFHDVVEVAGADSGSCARDRGGGVTCFQSYGTESPKPVPGLRNAIALVPDATCARLADGTLACWGTNEFGQLGDGTLVSREDPVAPRGLGQVSAVGASNDVRCALVSSGEVRCWGATTRAPASDARTGDAPSLLENRGAISLPVPSSLPAALPGLGPVVELGAGLACARKADGRMVLLARECTAKLCRTVPRPVPGLTDAAAIVDDAEERCVVRRAGGALAMIVGEPATPVRAPLASTSRTPRAVPLPALRDAVSVRVRGDAVCGVLPDGSMRCGRVEKPDELVVIPAVTAAQSLHVGDGVACALRRDGSLRCVKLDRDGLPALNSVHDPDAVLSPIPAKAL